MIYSYHSDIARKKKPRLFRFFEFLGFPLLGVFEEEIGDEPEGADGDGGIGHVEDGAEEEEVRPANPRHPLGPVELEQREVEHVDHAPLQQGGIAALGREQLCHVVEALVEYQAIEAAVDQVAHGTDEDEGKADDQRGADPFLDQMQQVPQECPRGHQTEYRKEYLADMAANGHAEGESLVFHEVQAAPFANQEDVLANVEVGLDPDFHHLVDDEDGGDETEDKGVLFLFHGVIVSCGAYSLGWLPAVRRTTPARICVSTVLSA